MLSPGLEKNVYFLGNRPNFLPFLMQNFPQKKQKQKQKQKKNQFSERSFPSSTYFLAWLSPVYNVCLLFLMNMDCPAANQLEYHVIGSHLPNRTCVYRNIFTLLTFFTQDVSLSCVMNRDRLQLSNWNIM